LKIVFLIRHASANHFEENIDDHEKGINKQGTLQSENIFKWIKKNDIKIDKIFSSTAKRAVETGNIVFGNKNRPIELKKDLYLCSSKEIIDLIKNLESNLENVAIIGHEPSMSETLKFLVGDARPDLKNVLSQLAYPTGSVAIVNLKIENWSQLSKQEGTLDAFLIPEELDGEK